MWWSLTESIGLYIDQGIVGKETHLWSDIGGNVVDIVKEQDESQASSLGYSWMNKSQCWGSAAYYNTLMSTNKEAFDPGWQFSIDTIVLELDFNVTM